MSDLSTAYTPSTVTLTTPSGEAFTLSFNLARHATALIDAHNLQSSHRTVVINSRNKRKVDSTALKIVDTH